MDLSDCQDFVTAREELSRIPAGSEESNKAREKLKSLICNKIEQKVCCYKKDKVEIICFLYDLSCKFFGRIQVEIRLGASVEYETLQRQYSFMARLGKILCGPPEQILFC